jgi:hypothetical protein
VHRGASLPIVIFGGRFESLRELKQTKVVLITIQMTLKTSFSKHSKQSFFEKLAFSVCGDFSGVSFLFK